MVDRLKDGKVNGWRKKLLTCGKVEDKTGEWQEG